MNRLISIFLLAVWLGAPVQAQTSKISFQDLVDPAALAFEDPFEAMGFAMLQELRTIVRLEHRLAQDETDAATRTRLTHQMSQAHAVLSAAGYDAEALIAQRWRVAEQRKEAKIATNPALTGNKVTISGFLIPAGRDREGAQLGYLVPQIGMCSHRPPPPPNQLLRVKLDSSVQLGSTLYERMEITGVVEPVASDEMIFLLDGEIRMNSRWTLVAEKIETKAHFAQFPKLSPQMHARRVSGQTPKP